MNILSPSPKVPPSNCKFKWTYTSFSRFSSKRNCRSWYRSKP
nr:MAG TPA: hypothetical protein [Caudoviricetes sp.]